MRGNFDHAIVALPLLCLTGCPAFFGRGVQISDYRGDYSSFVRALRSELDSSGHLRACCRLSNQSINDERAVFRYLIVRRFADEFGPGDELIEFAVENEGQGRFRFAANIITLSNRASQDSSRASWQWLAEVRLRLGRYTGFSGAESLSWRQYVSPRLTMSVCLPVDNRELSRHQTTESEAAFFAARTLTGVRRRIRLGQPFAEDVDGLSGGFQFRGATCVFSATSTQHAYDFPFAARAQCTSRQPIPVTTNLIVREEEVSCSPREPTLVTFSTVAPVCDTLQEACSRERVAGVVARSDWLYPDYAELGCDFVVFSCPVDGGATVLTWRLQGAETRQLSVFSSPWLMVRLANERRTANRVGSGRIFRNH